MKERCRWCRSEGLGLGDQAEECRAGQMEEKEEMEELAEECRAGQLVGMEELAEADMCQGMATMVWVGMAEEISFVVQILGVLL